MIVLSRSQVSNTGVWNHLQQNTICGLAIIPVVHLRTKAFNVGWSTILVRHHVDPEGWRQLIVNLHRVWRDYMIGSLLLPASV